MLEDVYVELWWIGLLLRLRVAVAVAVALGPSSCKIVGITVATGWPCFLGEGKLTLLDEF